MLKVPAPYPQVGSYGLFTDALMPLDMQRAELARVMRLGHATATIALPLRIGATGNRIVPLADLKDATPLTKDEERELHDLTREMAGRDRPNRKKLGRCNALRERLILSGVMAIEQRKLEALAARDRRRQGASAGTMLERYVA